MTATTTQKKTQPTKQQGERKEFLQSTDEIPLDIHYEWVELIRCMQAALKDNAGFARMNIVVSVLGCKPILYGPEEIVEIEEKEIGPAKYKIVKLSPSRTSRVRMTSSMAASLMALH